MSRNWLNWSPSQIQNFVRDRTAESVTSERLPFQQQAGEIEGNARGAAQRLGQAGGWATGQIGALQAGAEGSAKTFENQVADRAVQQQNAINEQRNQAEKSFGGPLTPGLAGQFVAEQGEAQQAGTAAQRAAGERTQGENNFMRQLREAAAMRSMEGQNAAANTFAGQLGKTRAAERAQIGRVQTRGQQEYPKMLQAQMNARLGLGKLGATQAAVAQRENASIRGAGQREAGNIRTNATRELTGPNAPTSAAREGHQVTRAGSKEGHEVAREGHQLTRLSAKERNAITAGKSGANKPMSRAQLAKVEGELGTAFAAFKEFNPQGITNTEIRNALPKGGLEGKRGGKAHTFKTGKPVGNQIFIRAAEEIWYNRQLSPEMKATFHELGIPEKAWSNELLGAPNQLAGVTGSTNAGVVRRK